MACPELDTGNAQGWLQSPRVGPCRKHGRPQLPPACVSGPCLSLCLPSLTLRMLFRLLGSLRPFLHNSISVYSCFSFKLFVLKRKKKKGKKKKKRKGNMAAPLSSLPLEGEQSCHLPFAEAQGLPRPAHCHTVSLGMWKGAWLL